MNDNVICFRCLNVRKKPVRMLKAGVINIPTAHIVWYCQKCGYRQLTKEEVKE